jgi:hypothetical protein
MGDQSEANVARSMAQHIVTMQNNLSPIVEEESRKVDPSIPQHIITLQNTYNPPVKEELVESNSRMQYLAVLAINIIAFAHGFSIGWISPYINLLSSNESPVGPLNDEQISYIGALLCFGAVIGTFAYGAMSDALGRKIASLSLAIPFIVRY